MSVMSDMSKAIRLELEKHGSTLRDIPTDDLGQITSIIGAFYADLKEELAKRSVPSSGDVYY